jgi:hypothetical protein
MLKGLGFTLVYLVSCVASEKALGKHDENILKTVGGPTLIIIIAFCALVKKHSSYSLFGGKKWIFWERTRVAVPLKRSF